MEEMFNQLLKQMKEQTWQLKELRNYSVPYSLRPASRATFLQEGGFWCIYACPGPEKADNRKVWYNVGKAKGV